jgi:hypothetical protein
MAEKIVGEAGREMKERPSKFNLLTNYEETTRAMAEVEGESWWNGDQKGKKTDYTTRGAVEHLARLNQRNAEAENDVVVFSVYGIGGVSRWMVMGDGEVRFSRFHDPEKAKKAEEAGFKIF